MKEPARYLLDTHVWIWWHMSPEKLSERVKTLIAESPGKSELLLSSISVWEFSKLVEKGRLKISCDGETWIEKALSIPHLRLVGIEPRIAWQSTCLPRPFHEDPADQLIVATAREEGAVILTRDQLIRKYEHVKSLW